MLDSYFRSPYQKIFIDPILKYFISFSPKSVTLLSCIFGITSAICLSLDKIIFSILFLLISGYLDTLDGSIARQINKTSSKGAALDIFSDRVVEFSIILGLYFQDPTRSLLLICMLGSILLCITSFLVVGIFNINNSEKSFHYSPGLIERTEAFLFFVLMILLPSFFIPLATLFSCLVLATSFYRLYEFQNYTAN